MAKVFVPQVPSRFDATMRAWVPTVNLEPAREFGELEIILPPEASRLPIEEIAVALERVLEDMTDDDWILTTGDPAIMGITMVIATRQLRGKLKILRWNRQMKAYEPVEVTLKKETYGNGR